MHRFLITLCLALVPALAAAQTATVLSNAPIYVTPVVTQTPLRVAAAGTTLQVLEDQGEWAKVAFNDPQWGRRIGWVQRSTIRIKNAALPPMDLSVKETETAATPEPMTPRPMQPEASQPPPAPAPPPSDASRGWIDVNFGLAFPGQKSLDTVGTYAYAGELATERATYDWTRGAEFDFGGGVMITKTFGLGINFQGTAHQDPVTLYANIPHPRFLNAYGSAQAPTADKLERTEGSANIQLVFKTDLDEHNSIRLFGGPTYFRLTSDAVGEVEWDQVYGVFTRANEVTITGWNGAEVEETGWGFHVGLDYAYYFTRIVGIGAVGRYSYGQVTFQVADGGAVIPDDDVKVQTGGFQLGFGLRLRF